MTTRFFTLSPTDTLFFRDGRPFNQDDMGLAHAHSVFPPFPTTVSGAIRAALALGRGWTPEQGSWASTPTLLEILGDGVAEHGDRIGRLSFGPPLPVRWDDKAKRWDRLYPVPLHLVGRPGEAWTDLTLLRPGPAVDCDLGPAVRLPSLPASGCPEMNDWLSDGIKTIEDAWLTARGLESVLAGKAPDPSDLVPIESLWGHEQRIGLERSPETRTAKHGMLYTSAHVRVKDGVAIGIGVDGLPDDWKPAPVCAFGGEHRTAWIEEVAAPAGLSSPTIQPGPDGRVAYAVILLTPALLTVGWNLPGQSLGTLPGKIVSACTGRPVMIGGWDGRSGNGGVPRPLNPFLPAGSVWFMEAGAAEFAAMNGKPPTPIGSYTAHGFGRIAIGTYDVNGAKA